MTQQSTYHRGSQNYGTGYEMMARIDELEAKLSALSKRHEKALALEAADRLADVMDNPVQSYARQRAYKYGWRDVDIALVNYRAARGGKT